MKTNLYFYIITLVSTASLLCSSGNLNGQTQVDSLQKHTNISMGIGSNEIFAIMMEWESPFINQRFNPFLYAVTGQISRCNQYKIVQDTFFSEPIERAECENSKFVTYVDVAIGMSFLRKESELRNGVIGQVGLRYLVGVSDYYNFGIINPWGFRFFVSENFYLRGDVILDIGVSYSKDGLNEWNLILPDFDTSFQFRIGYQF